MADDPGKVEESEGSAAAAAAAASAAAAPGSPAAGSEAVGSEVVVSGAPHGGRYHGDDGLFPAGRKPLRTLGTRSSYKGPVTPYPPSDHILPMS